MEVLDIGISCVELVLPDGVWDCSSTFGIFGMVIGINLASTALTGRICSGAALMIDPALLQNTVDASSCLITLAGPTHDPLRLWTFHIMTHSQASYDPRCGLLLRRAARRKDISLSAA